MRLGPIISQGILYGSSQAALNFSAALLIIFFSYTGETTLVFKTGIFYSLFAILQYTMSLRYELGMYIDGGKFKEKFLITALINSFCCLLILVGFFEVFFNYYELVFGIPKTEFQLMILACYVGATSLTLKQFYLLKQKANKVVMVNFLSIFILILTVLVSYSADTLDIYIFLYSHIAGNLFLIIYWIFRDLSLKSFSFYHHYETFMRGIEYLKFSTPGLMINLISQNFLILFLASVASENEVTQLIIIMRLLSAPLSIFAMPVSHAISSEITSAIKNKLSITTSLIKSFSIISLLVLLYHVLLILIPEKWLILFGIDPLVWMSLYFLLLAFSITRSAVSPFSNILNVLKKERLVFKLQSLNIFAIIIMIIFNYLPIESLILIYVINAVAFQLLVLINIYMQSQMYDKGLTH